MSAIIQLNDVCICYGDEPIMEDFSLKVEEGEKILFAGKSGSGKSSVIKALLGFNDVCEGEIYIKGQLIQGEAFNKVRKNFAYVNQDVTLRKGKIKDYIAQLEHYKHSTFKAHPKDLLDPEIMEVLEFSKDLLNKETQELSGGQRQRLGLILAIMSKRPIYLLDEVTAGLEDNLKLKVVDYFSTIPETVITVSHDSVWDLSGNYRKVVW